MLIYIPFCITGWVCRTWVRMEDPAMADLVSLSMHFPNSLCHSSWARPISAHGKHSRRLLTELTRGETWDLPEAIFGGAGSVQATLGTATKKHGTFASGVACRCGCDSNLPTSWDTSVLERTNRFCFRTLLSRNPFVSSICQGGEPWPHLAGQNGGAEIPRRCGKLPERSRSTKEAGAARKDLANSTA